ncbi:MAG: hypothetical protein GXZ11_01400 [Tissierellia bacterium]|nr:hypothetical protein [Tissierellia bacterium]
MKLFSDVSCQQRPSSAKPNEPTKEPFELPPDPNAEKEIYIKGMSTDELIDACFIGIDLVTYDGEPFSRTHLVRAINGAIDTAEQTFDIAIRPVYVEDEMHDWDSTDGAFITRQYVPTFKRPVKEVTEMKYMYGTREHMRVPDDWILLDKAYGDVSLFPLNGNVQMINPAGTMPYFMYNTRFRPMAISISYHAGMDKKDIPTNLLNYIFKRAAIDVLAVWGDQIIGAGIASSSLSIDGLSQSIGTTQSAMYGGASARILEYRKDLEELTPVLRRHFAKFHSVVL